MMRDKNETIGVGPSDSIILIDFDLTGYGFRAFDWAYFLFYSSFSYTSFHPGTTFLPDDDINFFLQAYITQAGIGESSSLEEIRNEFDVHLTYVILSK